VALADYLTDDAGTSTDAGEPAPEEDAGTEPVDAGTPDGGSNFNPLGTLSIAPGFQVSDWKSLDDAVTRVAGLETDDPSADPKLYGLKASSKEIVSLGTWRTLAVGAKLSSAVLPIDEGGAQLNGIFVANRETVWVGYKRAGFWPRAFLFSETRAWGARNTAQTGYERGIDVFGDYSATGFGDYFATSATGVDAQTGKGIYFLLGGGGNFNDQLVATHSGSSPAHISQAQSLLTIVGVPSTFGEKLYACRWKEMQETFIASINPPYTPVRVENRCTLVHQQKDIAALAPMKSGIAVSAPSSTGELVQFVDLSVTGTFDTQVVTPTLAAPLLNGPLPGTQIEFITPYATDLLVAVKDGNGRRLLRITR
jgi:hypothetical protein